jgi:hypothetical protein
MFFAGNSSKQETHSLEEEQISQLRGCILGSESTKNYTNSSGSTVLNSLDFRRAAIASWAFGSADFASKDRILVSSLCRRASRDRPAALLSPPSGLRWNILRSPNSRRFSAFSGRPLPPDIMKSDAVLGATVRLIMVCDDDDDSAGEFSTGMMIGK